MMNNMIKKYTDLKKIKTFEQRYDYLRLYGVVGEKTFGFDRYLNQMFYKTKKWRQARDEVIIRDRACDLGIEGYEINDILLVHHMNPISVKDIELDKPYIYDPQFLICTSLDTHRAIHYGDKNKLAQKPVVRYRNDTCPWK